MLKESRKLGLLSLKKKRCNKNEMKRYADNDRYKYRL